MKAPTRKASQLPKGLKVLAIPAALARALKELVRSIAGRATAAEPRAERRKRTCCCSSKAISLRMFCWVEVRPEILEPPVTAPALLPVLVEASPEPVAARR